MLRVRWLVAAFMMVALVAAGCGDDGEDSGTPQDGGDGEPIKIGASLPLTGEFSEPGKAAQQGYEVWATDQRTGGLLGRTSSSTSRTTRRTRTRSSPTTTR